MGQAKARGTKNDRIKQSIENQEKEKIKREEELLAKELARKEMDKICYVDVEQVKQWILKVHPKHPPRVELAINNCILYRVNETRYRIQDRTGRVRTFDFENTEEGPVLHETIHRDDRSNIARILIASAALGASLPQVTKRKKK